MNEQKLPEQELKERIANTPAPLCSSDCEKKYGCLDNSYPICLKHTDQILSLIKEAGHVQIDPDQSLPLNKYNISPAYLFYKEGQESMQEAGWRKVIL